MTSTNPKHDAAGSTATQRGGDGISKALTIFLAASVAVIALNLYASQPLIGLFGPALGMSAATASFVTMATLLGYGAGLVFLVPLVDLIPNRRLIVCTLAACLGFLTLAASTSSAAVFLAASAGIGFTATALQMLVPVAAALAPVARRGRVVGNVMSGLMLGTLLSRPIASLMADAFGWRSFYVLMALLTTLASLALLKVLPDRRPAPSPITYSGLIKSLGVLLREEAVLRRWAMSQFLLMGAFSVFWTIVALRLAAAPFYFGQRELALFALAASGALFISPLAGRLADRGRTRAAAWCFHGAVAISVMLAGSVANGAWQLWEPAAFPSLSIGVMAAAAFLISLGVTGNQIIGRHAINLIRPEARGRTNGLYTGIMFLGAAVAAFAAGSAWVHGGWSAVCWIGLLFALAALLLLLKSHAGGSAQAQKTRGSEAIFTKL
ncbi:MFS transporter [Achromobacter denitrificans]|uniref:MFS transporter n=1 Tax=Achromobacter denitrificans TaxID=32002 RepID=UPI003BA37AE4